MTYEDLRTQLVWEPVIQNGPVKDHTEVIIGGMGGSALPGNAMRFLDPALSVSMHRDYGLPENVPQQALYVAVSFSGNTEETLSFAEEAHAKGLSLAVVAAGGALLTFAQANKLPHVVLPQGLQPRNSTFYFLHALFAICNRTDLAEAVRKVSFDEKAAKDESQTIAQQLKDTLPVFYAARADGFLAYLWKIMVNETGKMPAFANIFPEMNHNEMQSYDTGAPDAIMKSMRFILLRNAAGDSRTNRRMDAFAACMRERGRMVTDISLSGDTRADQLVRGWFVAYLSARHLAEARNIDPDSVPLVEDFKKRLG